MYGVTRLTAFPWSFRNYRLVFLLGNEQLEIRIKTRIEKKLLLGSGNNI